VNHTLLTVAEARRRGLDIVAVVLNGPRAAGDDSWRTNVELIERFGDVPVLGPLPWLEGEADALPQGLGAALDLTPILAVLDAQEAIRA
jgi:dethiobiotin synthetase